MNGRAGLDTWLSHYETPQLPERERLMSPRGTNNFANDVCPPLLNPGLRTILLNPLLNPGFFCRSDFESPGAVERKR